MKLYDRPINGHSGAGMHNERCDSMQVTEAMKARKHLPRGQKHRDPQHYAAMRNYMLDVSLRQPPYLEDLTAATYQQTAYPQMATDPEQGQLLAFLIQSINAKRIIEIGVFTGIGTLWMADAAGMESTVVACDINSEYPAIGFPFWTQAGLSNRIDLRIAPALETLKELQDEAVAYDFCYIDADKESYDLYYEAAVNLMRPGGIIAIDNMLRDGRVADMDDHEEAVDVIRTLSAKMHIDARVDISFVPVCDGLYLARKR